MGGGVPVDSWRRVAERLEREKTEAYENLDVAIYFADNLQRIIDHKPVRDLAESRMAFENVRRSAEIRDSRLSEETT